MGKRLVIKGADFSAHAIVTSFTVSPNSLEAASVLATYYFDVTSQQPFNVSSQYSWLSVSKSGTQIVCTVSANAGGQRTGSFVVTSGDESITIQVVQSARASQFFGLTPEAHDALSVGQYAFATSAFLAFGNADTSEVGKANADGILKKLYIELTDDWTSKFVNPIDIYIGTFTGLNFTQRSHYQYNVYSPSTGYVGLDLTSLNAQVWQGESVVISNSQNANYGVAAILNSWGTLTNFIFTTEGPVDGVFSPAPSSSRYVVMYGIEIGS